MRPGRAGRRGCDGAGVSGPQRAGRLGGSGGSAPQRPAARQHPVVVEQHEGQLRRCLWLGGRRRAALGGRSGQRQPRCVPGSLASRLGGAQRRLLAVVAAAREAWGRRVLGEPARGGCRRCRGQATCEKIVLERKPHALRNASTLCSALSHRRLQTCTATVRPCTETHAPSIAHREPQGPPGSCTESQAPSHVQSHVVLLCHVQSHRILHHTQPHTPSIAHRATYPRLSAPPLVYPRPAQCSHETLLETCWEL